MGKLKLVDFECPFEDGQDGMKNMVPALAKTAHTLSRVSGLIKVFTIALGAIAATNGVAVKLIGESSPSVIVVYTIVGVVISILAGLEAVFRFEKRASELTMLAASAEAEGFRHATRWHQTVALESDDSIRPTNAKLLLEEQTVYIATLLKSSADLGVNLPMHLKRESRGDGSSITRTQGEICSRA